MYRHIISFLTALLLFLFITVPASAFDESTIINDSGAASLIEEYGGRVDFGRVFSVIGDSISKYFKSVISTVLIILAIIILASVFNAYCGGTGTLSAALSYATILAISGCTFSVLSSVFAFASESIASECRYMTAFLPVAASLYTLGGSVATGVAGSSALLAFLSIAGNFSSNVLMPLMQGGFILSLSSALPFGTPFRSVTNLAKNTVTTLLAFVFSIFGMVMYLQTVITAASDSFAFRTVKFASGAFIPVIGSMLGDAARTVASSAAVIRATVGGVGIIALLAVILPAVINTLLYKLGMLVCAMTARALGCERESGLLYDINSVLSVLLAIELGIGAMFVIAIALFIKTGVNI